MARALAHVEVINEVRPVFLVENGEPAQGIELARVLGWLVVVKKGEFKVGDLAVYIEVDSKLPADNPNFDFLASKDFKIKAMKLNKFYSGDNRENRVISQGILFPISIIESAARLFEGKDITEELKITKVEDETKEPTVNIDHAMSKLAKKHWFLKTKLGSYLMRFQWFRNYVKSKLLPYFKAKKYPTYIIKTDETRVQAIPQIFEKYKGKPLQVTEKLDGTSTTFGLEKISKNKFDFAICSRNVRQLDQSQQTFFTDAEANVYWEMANKYRIKEVLEALFDYLGASSHVYIQGETIGPSIQGNKYKLAERDFYAFNLVVDGVKYDSIEAARILYPYDIKWVPILSINYLLPDTIEQLLIESTDRSMLCDTPREGVVIRDNLNTVSFKAVSPEFLIKHKL